MAALAETIQDIRVALKEGGGQDARTDALTVLLKAQGSDVTGIDVVTVYSFQDISADDAEQLRQTTLTDALTQISSVNTPLFAAEGDGVLRIGLRPQVSNPKDSSLRRAARHWGIHPTAVATSTEYVIHGFVTADALAAVGEKLANQIETFMPTPPETLVFEAVPTPVQTIPVTSLAGEELETLSKTRSLFLTREEMQVIADYFRKLGREPTDVELETLAQTWSEHNGHKTFKAKLINDETGEVKKPLITRIKETAQKYFDRVGVVTAFRDNAGGTKFYEGWAIIGKWETHNSPVAIEPFGGSATKNGGVYRDIAGTGTGGINLVAFMINNLASPKTHPDDVPPGCLHPKHIMKENSRGEREYGNPMGIPTHRIDLHVHPDFVAKPTSMGGVIGLISETACAKVDPQPGDLLVTVGGKTGKDGIHGATFSSGEMTSKTQTIHATAVQLGNPIEEKRMFDALIAASEEGLIRTITDCGGGGYSSAIGEMGQNVGVEVELARVPLKYKGLSPWEIWLSESQERMAVAIDPANWERFLEICTLYDVPADIIGKFTGDGRLTLQHNNTIVGDLSMKFLHDGLPQRELYMKSVIREEASALPPEPTDITAVYKQVLSHFNVASTEAMLRQYDTTVQGRTVLHPFGGVYHDAPNDASVIAPLYGKPYGVITAGGSNPVLNNIDPYWGSVWAVAKAISNYAAVGGNPNQAALIDNFVWPYPDAESLFDLDLSVMALCDMMNALELPCVSGKDSLSSTYRYPDGTVLKIPPVLHVSIFGKIEDVAKTVTSDIKSPDSTLVLVGAWDPDHLGGSVYFDTQNVKNTNMPQVDIDELPNTLFSLHEAIQRSKILSCHDIAEGGLATTIAQMCFGGDCGAEICLDGLGSRADLAMFNETAGCFIVEVESAQDARELFAHTPHVILGNATKEKVISMTIDGMPVVRADVDDLKTAWKNPLEEVFP